MLIIVPGSPGGSDGKEPACNVGDPVLIPESGRYPGEGQATHSRQVFLPGEFHGQSSLVGHCPRGHKESDTTEQLTLSLSRMVRSRVSISLGLVYPH